MKKKYALQCLCFNCLLPEVKNEKMTNIFKMLNMKNNAKIINLSTIDRSIVSS